MSTQTEAQHYPNHDAEALGQDYINHISAMTTEGLRAKSSIAIQLAWRDVEIRRLEADKDDWKDASFVFKERAVKAEARIKELEAANAELLEALSFYADSTRYHGPNQSLNEPDKWSDHVGLKAYRLDVTRDGGVIASAAIKKHGGAA